MERENTVIIILLIHLLAMVGCASTNNMRNPNQDAIQQSIVANNVNNTSASNMSDPDVVINTPNGDSIYLEQEWSTCFSNKCYTYNDRVWKLGNKERRESRYEQTLQINLADGKDVYTYVDKSGITPTWSKTISGKTYDELFVKLFELNAVIKSKDCMPDSAYANNFSNEIYNSIDVKKYGCKGGTYWYWEGKNLIVKVDSEDYKLERNNFNFEEIHDDIFTQQVNIE